jgi:GntR family transcriptional regulator, arabinose operon transcriptional repressor
LTKHDFIFFGEILEYTNKKDVIYQQLKKGIESGEYAPETRFPTEVNFAKQLGVARVTLRSALDRLLVNGMIKRIPSKGTFVSPENIKSPKAPAIMIVRYAHSGFESPHNYIVPEIVRIAESKDCKTLSTTGTALLMFSSANIKNYVKNSNVIGIIVVMNAFRGDETIIKKLRNTGVPVVIAHCSKKDTEVTGFAGIAIDEKKGWEAAVSHLAECGHKNIGLIGYSKRKNEFRGFNKQECMKLLKKYNAQPVKSLICSVEFDKKFVLNTVKEMFSVDTKPTAILCYSDFFAIYVYAALKKMNLRIPEDVAVMGICGYPDAKLLTPPLSTVDYEYAQFADMALEMILEPKKWFTGGKGKLREKSFKIRKRKSTKRKIT